MEIKEDDILLGMCTYHNNETRTVYPGSTHTDEMCNIYIMFYTENAQQIMSTCSGSSNPELEKRIPDDAKVKPNTENNGDAQSLNDHKNHDMNSNEHSNRNYFILVAFFLIVFVTFLVSILILIKRQKRRNERSNVIRFKQLSSDSKSSFKGRSRFEWVKNWTLNRNRKINFAKLNQNDEDSDGGETVRFNKVSGAPVTNNLVTDSESEDVVMSLNR